MASLLISSLMTRRSRALLVAYFVIAVFAVPWIVPAQQEAADSPAPFDLLLTGGRVLDGTGNPWFYGDVGIRHGRIVAVGKLKGAATRRVLDVAGKVVTPGFIDVHSHGDRGLTSKDARRRAAPNLVAQGVTTIVVNQDGRSPWPIRDQRVSMQTEGIGPNALLLIGHFQEEAPPSQGKKPLESELARRSPEDHAWIRTP